VLSPGDLPSARRELTKALDGLRDPFSGRPVVASVRGREELYQGAFVERAPDLILELALDPGATGSADGYTYNLASSATAPSGTGVFRRLAPEEYLGRKGRTLSGSHRARGLFIACGPKVQPEGEVQAGIADVAATLLCRMAIAPPPELDGFPLGAVRSGRATRRLLPGATSDTGAPTDEARVRDRLRSLGYIE
jgi:hypothetical protein